MNLRENDVWGWRECVALLVLDFVGVIVGIKLIVQPMYEQWLDNDLYAGTLMGLTVAITLMIGVYFIALRPRQLSWKEVGVRTFQKNDWKLIGLYTTILVIGSIILMLLTMLVGNQLENSKTDAMQANFSMMSALIAFISAVVISPIYEEIFYRGFMYRFFRNRVGIPSAIVISSLIFTIAHIPTYNAMPVNFLGGVIFALAYERTNSIWPPVLIHGLTNAVFVFATFFG